MKSGHSYAFGALAATGSLAVLLAASTVWAQETKEKVTVDDVDRNFMVRLPKGYDPQQHYPVVILLHGMNQDPEDIERLTRFNELADKDGVIAVYPYAQHGRWNVGVRAEERRSIADGPGKTAARRLWRRWRLSRWWISGRRGRWVSRRRRWWWRLSPGRRTAAASGWPAQRGASGRSRG